MTSSYEKFQDCIDLGVVEVEIILLTSHSFIFKIISY